MVFQLDDNLWFPSPSLAVGKEGLLAVGGDLSPIRLILAYSFGIFPWFPYKVSVLEWYCPQQRFVIYPNEIHVSHSMRNLINKGLYHITVNTDFEGVIRGCSEAELKGKDKVSYNGAATRNEHLYAWLGEDMIQAYMELNRLGYAVSVEVRDSSEELVGGLYGVIVGKAFMGESMFSKVPSASKLALIFLADRLSMMEGTVIDCQFETPHLKSMGGRLIPYEEFLKSVRPEHPGPENGVRDSENGFIFVSADSEFI